MFKFINLINVIKLNIIIKFIENNYYNISF